MTMKLLAMAKSWLQLLRFPNLFTVPGDPLMGMMLVMSEGGSIRFSQKFAVLAIMTSVSLYAAGMILNDVADLSTDSLERPERPIPSGRISRRSAIALAGALIGLSLVCGLIVSWKGVIVVLLLLSLIIFYNFAARKKPLLGFVTMSLCRSMSVIIGAVYLAGRINAQVSYGAAGLFVYIFAVCFIAKDEANEGQLGNRFLNYIPLFAAILWQTIIFSLTGVQGLCVLLLLMGVLVWILRKVTNTSSAHKLVGVYLAGLIPLQSIVCITSGGETGLLTGLLLFLTWPVALMTGKHFYSS